MLHFLYVGAVIIMCLSIHKSNLAINLSILKSILPQCNQSINIRYHSASGSHQRYCSSGIMRKTFDHVSTLRWDGLKWRRIGDHIKFKLCILDINV